MFLLEVTSGGFDCSPSFHSTSETFWSFASEALINVHLDLSVIAVATIASINKNMFRWSHHFGHLFKGLRKGVPIIRILMKNPCAHKPTAATCCGNIDL